jgi:diguanylate cyclase (GGDEF)-like protein
MAISVLAATESDLSRRLLDIEADLPGFPERARIDLAALSAEISAADPGTRIFAASLTGQALVASGHKDDALRLADDLERGGAAAHDDATIAVALMIHSEADDWAGDTRQAQSFAAKASALAQGSGNDYVKFWATLSSGVAARKLGHLDEALTNLQEAYVLADAANNSYRRANALYQLSVLNRNMKQGDRALDNSRQAFSQAKLANSTYGMAKAKMGQSAALELLDRPVEELSAMQDALAIAREAHSAAEECLALINLSDIYLRRKDFKAAVDLSQRSLQLATGMQDVALVATSKANVGFALFGLGRIEEGKRPAEEALAEYERSGADAEYADLLEEYGKYLANSGDYKGALALRNRQQKVLEKVAHTVRDRDLMEMQSRFDAEKRQRQIEKLTLDKDRQAVEIRARQLEQRIWWLLAAVFAASFAIVAVLYRKLRTTNRLLAQRNSELSIQSSRDPLTSLYNRRHFQSFINEVHGEADRRRVAPDKATQAILLIDLDHFKLINDQFGHAAGDAVLVAIARRLREVLRETDMIVRWGGEEFLVFVPMAPVDRLDEIVLRIMHAVSSEPVQYLGHALHLTASIGFSPLLLPPGNVALGWERVLGLADQALYLAKLNGRNRAYGVGAMRRSGDDALAAIDANLELAWQKGIVELRMLPGDVAIVSATTVARPAPASIER